MMGHHGRLCTLVLVACVCAAGPAATASAAAEDGGTRHSSRDAALYAEENASAMLRGLTSSSTEPAYRRGSRASC